MVASLAELEKLIDLLKAKDIEFIRWGDLELRLASPIDTTPEARPAPDSTVCACGHGAHEHSSDGLCLHGCDVETCAPEEKK